MDKQKNQARKQLNARELALQALIDIEQGGAYSNLYLHQLLQTRKLDPRDRGLTTELVYGVLQQQRLLDFYLQPFIKRQVNKLEPWVKQLLRLSIYQINYLDRIPVHAVVNEAVEIAKRRGHRGITGLVNGVLRNYLRTPRASLESIDDQVERLAIESSHPTWLVKRWIKQYGFKTTREICLANNQPAKLTIRVNLLKTTREKLHDSLTDLGFSVKKTTHSPVGLIVEGSTAKAGELANSHLFREGYFTFQDESSMLVSLLLDAKPGMLVLDACAAPGGKTTHLGELMANQGEILALDIHPHKQKLIEENAKRLGIKIIKTKVLDARQLPNLYRHEGTLNPVFDRILLDAPCSGFGVIRRKPDLKWKKQEQDIEQISQIQYELLKQVSLLLKDNGQLVYSTCTLEEVENELMIERFLEEHPNFYRVEGSTRKIFPHHFGSDGFYMTKLQKSE